MTFTPTQAFAVEEALSDLHDAGVSEDLYNAAQEAVISEPDGSFTIDPTTVGSAKLLVRACEILLARPEYA